MIPPCGLIPNDYRPEKKKGKRKKADVCDKNGKPKRQGSRKRYQLSILPACGIHIPLPFCTSARSEPFAVFILIRFFCFFSLFEGGAMSPWFVR